MNGQVRRRVFFYFVVIFNTIINGSELMPKLSAANFGNVKIPYSTNYLKIESSVDKNTKTENSVDKVQTEDYKELR